MASSVSPVGKRRGNVHPEDDSAPSPMQIQKYRENSKNSSDSNSSVSSSDSSDDENQRRRSSLTNPVDFQQILSDKDSNRKKKKKYSSSSKTSSTIDHHQKTTEKLFVEKRRKSNESRKSRINEQNVASNSAAQRTSSSEIEQINLIIENTKIPVSIMEQLVQQNPILSPTSNSRHRISSPSSSRENSRQRTPSPSKTSGTLQTIGATEVTVYPSSVSLRGLLSYQDVLAAIEREFHLHDGQEREIIMKLWLKGQTMISILQRYRYLLQDLNLDDQDFLGGMKQIREMINYGERDVQYLREQKEMLENQNRFLESEFQRQLDKVITEKNEQISRLIQIIDQNCPSGVTENGDQISDLTQSSANPDHLAQKFMQKNVELQRELETLRAKLEYTFTLLNEKLENQQTTSSVVQLAIEQMRNADARLEELQLRTNSQKEENDLLRYLIERSQRAPNLDTTQLFNVAEQRTLDRDIDRARQELTQNERKIAELEQRLDKTDQTTQFNIDRLKLKCETLRQHIENCSRRLDEASKSQPVSTVNEQNLTNESNRRNFELENELLLLRENYQRLDNYAHELQYELENARKQLNERSLMDRDSFESSLLGNESTEIDIERQRSAQLENELISLKSKYDDVCERVTAATIQLERVQIVLEQTLRRCEQLEKEKSEINAQSEYLSQNVATVAAKYKDKISTIKARLEQTDRERRDAQLRSEQLQNEIERLKGELSHRKEMIFEKEKIIQDAQYKNREILLERQSVEDRISNDYKRLNELVDKNRFLEEELERARRGQILENITLRRTDVINIDGAKNAEISNRLEEMKIKMNEYERRLNNEKSTKESLQVQVKILEEENADLRIVMSQMRKRAQDDRREDRDRNDEIQQLIARAESNARQYMSNFNLRTPSPTSTLVRIIPVSSPTKFS